MVDYFLYFSIKLFKKILLFTKLIDMGYNTIIFEQKNKVAYLNLNRPDGLNSFNMKMGVELYEALNKISKDKNIRIVVIKGSGKGFCGGGDVKEMYNAIDKSKFLREITKDAIHKCVKEIRTMEKPVIAIVNGAAFGAGLSLALACDIIIADKKAQFSSAFIGVGLAPGCGTQFFTKILAYQKACEYILTSKLFSAEEAGKIGLINHAVEKENIKQVLDSYISRFLNLPPIAIGKAKMLINKSYENNMIEHLDLESKTVAYTAGTEDFIEGISAFVEKRKAKFKGK